MKTLNVKNGLITWIEHWKEVFSKDLHKKAKNMLENLQDEIKQISLKVKKPAENIDSLGSVMSALEEIRNKESIIDRQFRPIKEMYALLEQFLKESMEQDEVDGRTEL